MLFILKTLLSVFVGSGTGWLSADERGELKSAMVGKSHPDYAGNWGRHLEALEQPQPREWRE